MLRPDSSFPTTPTSTALLPEMAAILVELNRSRLGRTMNDPQLKQAVFRCADQAVRAHISRGELQSRLRSVVEYVFSSEGASPYAREALEQMLAWVRGAYEREDARLR